jgi:SpoVK/Ycf46/Vps4 family AAA+-type ATPase
MEKSKRLAASVNLEELASQIEGFSGADIKGLVEKAAQYALVRSNKHMNSSAAQSDKGLEEFEGRLVTMEDFKKALETLRPADSERPKDNMMYS